MKQRDKQTEGETARDLERMTETDILSETETERQIYIGRDKRDV